MSYQPEKSGGLANWSINHPVSVIVILAAIIVLGLFSLSRLGVDLLPDIIYPEVRVRILNPGVPAQIMEDEITRQLEEQLAITEGAINIQSRSSEGRSNVDLSFPYGTDIDVALRDASTRLDRAKRFLPTDIDPPIIYKRDPSQIPIMELIVSSELQSPVELRSWVDYNFSKWFLNLPGIASTEVGGGLIREINIELDPIKLAHHGFSIDDIKQQIERENRDISGGKLYGKTQEISIRSVGRFQNINEIADLPLTRETSEGIKTVYLKDLARVNDSHEDERLRIRLNGLSGVKLSIQKQPTANTVDVVDLVLQRLEWLKQNKLIPDDVVVQTVGDQSVFIRHSVDNAASAAFTGAMLAMLIVYLFLGNMVRTIIIGSAIPIAVLVTFIIMNLSGITLNIMTLGGLALGVGMLVDSTIVMLENISRHQQMGESPKLAASSAAIEVNSPIVASTSTNLAAVLPFLMISGLTGLLFKELIITIGAAMIASLFVALTLVPALGSQVKTGRSAQILNFDAITRHYQKLNTLNLQKPLLIIFIALPLLLASGLYIKQAKSLFLPKVDEGNIDMRIKVDSGIQLNEMDDIVYRVENLLLNDPQVDSVFSTVGGFVFGRSEFISSNRSSLRIQLKKQLNGKYSSEAWIKTTQKKLNKLGITGVSFRLKLRGVRGVRIGSGEDDISIRVRGHDIPVLSNIADQIIEKVKSIDGLRNFEQSYEDTEKELVVSLKRNITTHLGITSEDIGEAIRLSLDGIIVSEYLEGDQQFNIRVRNRRTDINNISDMKNIIVSYNNNQPVYLGDVANLQTIASTKYIYRDKQQRFVEVSASLEPTLSLEEALEKIDAALSDLELPDGYSRYQSDEARILQEGQVQGLTVLLLALFLVFVVMAIQYESVKNPFIILLTVPFSLIGVVLGIFITSTALSMSVWLGMIMLAGIVVNNSIVLVEQIEIEKRRGLNTEEAILKASGIRLKPILMTTLTTAIGMLPLALGFGEGAEMLQPLAIVAVFGLSFSMLVSLFLLPSFYKLLQRD